MCTDEMDGGCRFFKCPRAWVFLINIHFANIFLIFSNTYVRYWIQNLETEGNYGFSRWVDLAPIYPHQQYIYYLQGCISGLQREVRSGTMDEEEYNSDGVGSEEALCTDPYCNCPYHKKGPPPPPPPPPPPTMLGYCREGSTQFAMWEHYQE